MEVIAVVVSVVGLIGTIAVMATLVQARKLLPKNRFGPFVSTRRRNLGTVILGLGGLAFIIGTVAILTIAYTPSEKEHHSTYIIMFVAMGIGLLGIIVGNLIFQRSRQANVGMTRYSLTGREKPPEGRASLQGGK